MNNKDIHLLNEINRLKNEKRALENKINNALEYIGNYLIINEETGEYCIPYTFDSSNLKKLHDILKEVSE